MSKGTRTRTWLVVILALVVLTAALGAYSFTQLPTREVVRGTSFPLTVMDDLGRNVTLPRAPAGVISLVPSNTEIVFAIGGEGKLIAVDRFSKFPPKLEQLQLKGNITVVGGGFDPDIEKIVSLKPDLILANGPSQRVVLQKLEDLGFSIIYLRPQTLGQLYKNIRLIGTVLELQQGADELVKRMERRVQAVVDKVKGLPRVRIYMELWNNPLMSIGPGTLPDELVDLAGGINLFADSKEIGKSLVISSEAVVEKNPEVIILVHTGNTPAEVKNRSGWGIIITAVQKDRVYQLDGILVAPTPRVVEGLEQIARLLHPEAFA